MLLFLFGDRDCRALINVRNAIFNSIFFIKSEEELEKETILCPFDFLLLTKQGRMFDYRGVGWGPSVSSIYSVETVLRLVSFILHLLSSNCTPSWKSTMNYAALIVIGDKTCADYVNISMSRLCGKKSLTSNKSLI